MSILSEIQAELKAPKGQFNKFGSYNYRSCEDIVEAVKPFLASRGIALTISDEIVCVGGGLNGDSRFYVKATAVIGNGQQGDECFRAEAQAYAREPLSKKGMDEAQITGAASSYARKYALNGLFAIDDTKDADTQDNRIDNTVEIRQDYVDKAFALYSVEVENEVYSENGDFKKVQQANHYLTNDERIAVMEKFGKDTVPNSKKMLKSVLKDLLAKKGEDSPDKPYIAV